MTDQSPAATIDRHLAPPPQLEPDAIGVAQDTVIGLASAAPAVTLGLTLAALASAASYGSGPVIAVTAIPMLVIANACRRLNLWNANCGASFEWVGRAINPYLGFFTGWLMIAAYVTGAVTGLQVIGPAVIAVFDPAANANDAWANIAIATGISLVLIAIAVIGIRLTARTQVAMALVEYAILLGFTIAGLIAVLGHHPGTYPISSGWFSLRGIGGHGSLGASMLLAVFAYSGWDGTLYVNEEVKHRRVNPGRAVVSAVAILIFLYVLCFFGLQGVVSPARLQANSTSALVYVAQALGGKGWGNVMALALALSVIALTLTSVVLTARIIYGMASYRTLPAFLANVSRRFSTPVPASVLTGALFVALTWVYLLVTSVQAAFSAVVNLSGLLFGLFYIVTALAAMAYYRRRILSNIRDALTLGVLPLGSAGFLVWVAVRFIQEAPRSWVYALYGIFAAGGLLMLIARYGLKSDFFRLPRESDPKDAPEDD